MKYLTREEVLHHIQMINEYKQFDEETEKYENFDNRKEMLVYILKNSPDLILVLDKIEEFLDVDKYPRLVVNIIQKFVDPFRHKIYQIIETDRELSNIVFKPIIINNDELFEEKVSEIAASKIKKDKNNDKDKKKSTNVDFDIFNTF
jgi:hypothetical protein